MSELFEKNQINHIFNITLTKDRDFLEVKELSIA